MKTKITLLKTVMCIGLFVQAALCTALPVTHPVLHMPNFAPAAAVIASQPQSVNTCEGGTAQFTVAVTGATGSVTYLWRKDGVSIADTPTVTGTRTATLTITSVTERNAGAYTCAIFDGSGSELSEPAYLNAAIISENGSTTCQDTETVISVETIGNNVQYQWYSNTANSNMGGTIINGATSSFYRPAVNQAGTWYYYAEIYPEGYQECALVTSNPIAVNIGTTNAGTISQNQIVCPNSPAALSVSGSFGDIQWQQSEDGTDNWTNVTAGIGSNTPNYTTPQLSTSMFYRVEAGNLTCGYAYSQAVAVTVTQTYTWTGAANSNWNNTANWACGIIPTINENVLIPAVPGNQPEVSTGIAFAKTLTVESGASLTVKTGKTLHVQSSITAGSTGNITIEDNAALIQDDDIDNTGKITVIKNSNPLYRLDYTLWSSPVIGQELQDFSLQTVAGRFYEYKYDYDQTLGANREQFFQIDPTNDFEAGKAYLIRMPNGNATPGYNQGTQAITYTGTFTGEPNNGTITVPASVAGNRYTAVGNPYASPISLSDFFSQNEAVLGEDSALYLWRKKNDATATSYAILTLGGCVANDAVGGGDEQVDFYTGESDDWTLSQGQGFIVKTAATPSTTNIVFTNSMRKAAPISGTQGFFRTGQPAVSRLWVNLTGGQRSFSQAAVAYMDGATTGIDYGYDGQRINEGQNMTLYTIAQNKNLAIQARPAFNANDEVALGFVAVAAGEYTLALDHTEGVFTNGQAIYIKDNLLNTTTPLTGGYTFTTEAGTFNTRFQIVYVAQDALGTNTPAFDTNSIIVYKDGADVAINSGLANMTNVTVYDIGGRTLYGKKDVNATQMAISGLQAQQQVIIVEINTDKGKVSKKIVF